TRSLDESTSFWTSLGFSVVAEHDSPQPARRLQRHGLRHGFHETGRFRAALTFAAPQFDPCVEYLRENGVTPRLSSSLTVDSPRSATLVVPGNVSLFLLDVDDDGQ